MLPAATIPVVTAHTGHLLIDLLTFLPVVALAIWFVAISIKDRRSREGRDGR